MARLVVSMNLSLDGYIEALGQDDGSWLQIDDEVHRAFNELAAGAATFVYGRKVFEVMIPYWPDAAVDATRPKHEYDYARIWVDKPKVVFSSTFQQTNWNTRVVASGVLEEVEKLKRESSGYLLCYGGPQLVSALEERHLVDEYILYIHPAALGAGKPFFRSHTPLRLLDSRRFKVGTLELRYASGGEPG
jgi:dihydrofolate reductase